MLFLSFTVRTNLAGGRTVFVWAGNQACHATSFVSPDMEADESTTYSRLRTIRPTSQCQPLSSFDILFTPLHTQHTIIRTEFSTFEHIT